MTEPTNEQLADYLENDLAAGLESYFKLNPGSAEYVRLAAQRLRAVDHLVEVANLLLMKMSPGPSARVLNAALSALTGGET